MSRKPNQMEIGMTRKLELGGAAAVSILNEGRGVIAYAPTADGLRVAIRSSDGLDTYYFDMDREAVEKMAVAARRDKL